MRSDEGFLEAAEQALEALQDDQVSFLSRLIRVPSDNPPGDCAPHADATAGFLEEMGFTVERDHVPEAVCREHGMMSVTNLIVRQRFGPGPTIALNAHGDVVSPGDGWTVDPYGAAIRDGWLYGRGAAVSKSDIATFAFALLAMKQTGAELGGTIELHLTYDEETGGELGPRRLLAERLSRPDYAICAGFSYQVVTAHNGCLHLEVTVRGRSAHAAVPESGVDALRSTAAILSALYAENEGYAAMRSDMPGIGSPSLTVGLIEGGINTNVVPDRIAFRLDRRMIPEEEPSAVEARLRDILERSKTHSDIDVEVRRILLAEPMRPVRGVERMSAILSRHASRILDTQVDVGGVPLYADARHYAAAGIPTVMYGAGPRTLLEANAHRADERVGLNELQKATTVIIASLSELLSR